MIKYTLKCAQDHRFEAWFRSSADYDAQDARRLLSCPACGSPDIEKAIMAPNVGKKANTGSSTCTQAETESPNRERLVNKLPKEYADFVRGLRKHVQENSDYVGDKFAEEARKIHYEEVEPRGIYGEASKAEVKELAEEGISFQPLPGLPEDKN